ncbi:anthranilate phosphoribosyltransferase [Luteitalea sp. TBR-22]|uniref:anthranilate phosphoribosyltransferase n=1 Tax=Luteitalea sp. TBR-22 TaxID=2802971 RepID=UPI001EF535C4|nr:anthranilate phosphoribosyltransferase [Luteitalea sp. TBR-22]
MFAPLLEKLQRHVPLTTDEAAAAMAAIMRGEATAAQVAGFLMALRSKGERPEELVGLARAMRAAAVPLPQAFADVFDTCGTGGDNAGTVNVSSMAAVVLAASGVRVAKHGNRSVSSRSGSADVFEALGVNVAATPAVVARCLDEVGIAFLFAPTFHPSMKHAAPVRRELGVRTAFNLLGPLTNPAGTTRQLVGVPRPELTELVARALGLLGSTHVWVVHAADGLDELSTTGYTKVSECRGGLLRTFFVHPGAFGLAKATLADLKGGDAAYNADVARRVLAGEPGPVRDIVLLNAGAGLFIAGRVPAVAEGVAAAAAAIDDGRAAATLRRLVEVSQASVEATA